MKAGFDSVCIRFYLPVSENARIQIFRIRSGNKSWILNRHHMSKYYSYDLTKKCPKTLTDHTTGARRFSPWTCWLRTQTVPWCASRSQPLFAGSQGELCIKDRTCDTVSNSSFALKTLGSTMFQVMYMIITSGLFATSTRITSMRSWVSSGSFRMRIGQYEYFMFSHCLSTVWFQISYRCTLSGHASHLFSLPFPSIRSSLQSTGIILKFVI